MKNLYLRGLEITLFLGIIAIGLVIVGWFLYREYIIAITIGYLLVHIVLWLTIMVFTLKENKNEKRKRNY